MPVAAAGHETANESEYKGFTIRFRLQDNAWTATIEKRNGASLLINIPGSSERREQSLDTPPQDSAIDAIRLALDLIDGGGVL